MHRTRLSLIAFVSVAIASVAIGAEETVDNPNYVTWAKEKAGTSVTHSTVTTVNGKTPQKITMETTQVLFDLKPDVATIEVRNTLNMAGKSHTAPPVKTSVKAKVPKGQAGLPEGGGASGQVEPMGKETITVAGKSYDCDVVKFTGETKGVKTNGKIWRSDTVPGGVVKMTLDATGTTPMTIEMELLSFTKK